MTIISAYNACCNLGLNIDEIYNNAINFSGLNSDCFFEYRKDIIKGKTLRLGVIKNSFDEIKIEDEDFNLRCNKIILHTIKPLEEKIRSYNKNDVAIICATTNSGAEEFSHSKKIIHQELSNPALFLKKYFDLNNVFLSISTACSSGAKAFSTARDILNNNIAKIAIVVGIDSIATLPLFGFSSLEILSSSQSNPFSINSTGINIAEAAGIFIVEKEGNGIEIAGIGETSDYYHNTSPNPKAHQEIKAIKLALNEANLKPDEIDYINLHGTGTKANDTMEARAIYEIFKDKVPVSSTKPLTGHCLGAAPSIEAALCCHLLNKFEGKYFKHIYDGLYQIEEDRIKLVQDETYQKCDTILSNSFGFSGSSASIIFKRVK